MRAEAFSQPLRLITDVPCGVIVKVEVHRASGYTIERFTNVEAPGVDSRDPAGIRGPSSRTDRHTTGRALCRPCASRAIYDGIRP